jgi:hypothetical protein
MFLRSARGDTTGQLFNKKRIIFTLTNDEMDKKGRDCNNQPTDEAKNHKIFAIDRRKVSKFRFYSGLLYSDVFRMDNPDLHGHTYCPSILAHLELAI